jgi:hypothetical protein
LDFHFISMDIKHRTSFSYTKATIIVGKSKFHAIVKKKGPNNDPKSMLRYDACLGI